MTENEVPVLFFVLLAVGVAAALGLFGCVLLIMRRLGLTMIRNGSEWNLSREQNAVLRKALWGRNAHLRTEGLVGLVWAVRLMFIAVAASVFGCALTLAGAAK
ncbi:MAG: hypothetical protein ABIJ73_11905 [Pseudomonadota bacterium]|uniref:hypothetical protein n=1 Tax=Brevundimonas sp. TaxID=1871086 RepID=UPI00180A4085|nr:hypothetical protein [Brevundimonas sp.]MBU3971708.1 hypothetical protein [Alphaproteobacteria bacterium]MBA3049029.1 hypothetical protein [Brevundimonas sp.]MBU3973310.1 hypothetical protein [Alphaproteobacteria bacterium]MBU4040369.1 hypothetical protein [Alphaproteobacteria bacterium]MBU4135957.1 hypothetical protein [Alphaproteobacteria bacterium]